MTKTPKSRFENMNPDTKGIVFRYLTVSELLARVSPLSIALNQSVQQHLERAVNIKISFDDVRSEGQLNALLERFGKNLQGLDLSGNKYVTNKTLEIIKRLSPDLQVLNLEGCNRVTDVGLQNLRPLDPSKSSALTYLNLSGCELITDAGIGNLSSLTNLNISGCNQITQLGIQSLVTSNPALEDLSIRGCYLITNVGILSSLTSLRSLDISVGSDVHGIILCSINDAEIVALSSLTNLENFTMIGCELVTDDAFRTLIAANKGLRTLTINYSDGLTNTAIQSVGELCHNLQNFSLIHCPRITNSGIASLSQLPINSLNLGYCRGIDDGTLQVLSGFQQLQNLSVAGRSITDKGLRDNSLSGLRSIDLSSCYLVTDEGVRHLSSQSPHLEAINISSNSNLTDEGVKNLTLLPNLRSIDISSNQNITYDGVRSLSSLPNLQHLDARYCQNLNLRNNNLFISRRELLDSGVFALGLEEKKEAPASDLPQIANSSSSSSTLLPSSSSSSPTATGIAAIKLDSCRGAGH